MSLAYPRRQRQLESLVKKLGLPKEAAIQWHLLDLALTHPTVSESANYEQLEFVGDAVVRLVAAVVLWEHYPDCPVGDFAAIRSVLVSDRILAQLAREYGLELYLLVAGSATADKVGQESRLADAFEAVLGALYLSTHNLELIRPWLDPHFKQLAAEIRLDPARLNYKAALQEWTQAQFKVLPEYRVVEVTQPHRNQERFVAEVWLHGKQLGQGKGRSIKAAEQAAAKVAFLSITNQEQP
ncbi:MULTISPECIES: ribonuclease III [Nostocales]|uniref:Ribonuclease 3 n=2 Tax=Calothrix TaxID=1186 RepID=A0ABR8AP31_9CYAN|nr:MULTISPECIES: ribonuclease III [Nostocales]BAY64711.1 ribonuclease III [Calothrix brevissima NIES-22]MBD2200441.1 ribonuclease III [Calothrix parietina FACHB-288]MBD2202587.1 ribonuclease III [Calothrix sp. FACHB-168]MBD2217823.1 ribonuclease III [Calothrix sp. FACHB-1219]MBD2229440.1 ribonuclease III [Calothrix anomala FACHB-343]